MSKKASFHLAGESVKWFFNILAFIIVLVVFAMIVGAFVNTKIDVSSIEHRVILNKIIMQQGCINFYDGNRWQDYSVDAAKFNAGSLEECLNSGRLGVRLKLLYDNKENMIVYNERMVGYASFCKDGTGFRCSNGRIAVRVYEGTKRYNGYIDYEVVTKHE